LQGFFAVVTVQHLPGGHLSCSGGASFRAAAERLRLKNMQSLLRAKPPKDGDAELRD